MVPVTGTSIANGFYPWRDMIPFKFTCPRCHQSYDLELEALEQKAQCECGARVLLKVGPPAEVLALDIPPAATAQEERTIPAQETAPVSPQASGNRNMRRVAPDVGKRAPTVVPKKSLGVLPIAVVLMLMGGAGWFVFKSRDRAADPKGASVESTHGERENTVERAVSENAEAERGTGGTPGVGAPFSMAGWKEKYGQQRAIGEWGKDNPFPWGNYFSGSSEDCAKNWYIKLGPLGARVYFHDMAWDEYSAFRARVPFFLRDDAGMVANAIEVLTVDEGSPADGFLKPGDIITEIDGQALLSSPFMFPDREVHARDTRGMEIHVGQLMDEAEGNGRIRMKLIRPPSWTSVWESLEITPDSPEAEFRVDVSGANSLRLSVNYTGPNDAYCWANWVEPMVVTQTGERIPLTRLTWDMAKSGWKDVQVGTNVGKGEVKRDGQVVSNVLGTHAHSVIEYTLPQGAKMITGIVQVGNPRAHGLKARIEVKAGMVATYPKREWKVQAEKSMMTGEEKKAPWEFRVPLEDAFAFRLIATDGGNGNGYDHLRFVEVVLENAEGKGLRLDELRNTIRNNGYGGVTVNQEENEWKVHAPCTFEYLVPEGGPWTLKGKMIPGGGATIVSRVQTLTPPGKAPELEALTQTVEWDIPRIGSFGKVFDPDSEKMQNYRAMLAHRLAVQQEENGSWGHVYSYSTPVFHTSMAGLGLLAQADPQYEDNIRRAARYVADNTPNMVGDWSYPQGTAILFLAEYYLRTKDESILPALERAVVGVRPNILSDYTSGHKLVPGYGGSGWIGGGGMITCGLAVASLTPIQMTEPDLVDKMLERIQELAPGGQMPYGRVRGWSDYLADPKVDGGQGWSAGTGPYFLGALVRGGADYFVKAVRKRYANPPWGDADGGHATHMLPFVWASIGIANCGPESHRGNMEAFAWKLTLHREYDGFMNRNTNRLEYHGAEGVIGNPYWGMGGHLILFNAHRHNLAITGQPGLVSHSLKPIPVQRDHDRSFWRSLSRDWNIVATILGKAAPPELARTVKELESFPQDLTLGETTFHFLRDHGPAMAQKVLELNAPDLKAPLRQYLAEMLLGVDIEILFGQGYREGKKDGDEGRIRIDVRNAYTRWKEALPPDRRGSNPVAASEISGRVTLRDPSRKFLKEPVTFEFSPGKYRWDQTMADVSKDKNIPLVAEIAYRAGGMEIAYARTVIANSDDPMREFVNFRKVWVPGYVQRDQIGHSLPFRLPNGVEIGAADREGCDMVWHEKTRSYRKGDRGFLIAGTPCRFLVSSGDHWEALVHEIQILDPNHGALHDAQFTMTSGSVENGEMEALRDGDWGNGPEMVPQDGRILLEWTFAKPARAHALENRLNRDTNYRLEVERDGKWTVWGTGRTSGWRKVLLLAPVESTRFRLILEPDGGKKIRIHELRLFGGV